MSDHFRVVSCFIVSFLIAASTFADEWDAPAGYYASAMGTGPTLKTQLETIMTSGHVLRTYGSFRYSAAITDQDPNNASNILLAYNRTSVPSNWDSGATWNREHVWPQSLQPGSASNGSSNALSDPFSLRPANPSVNSSRGNKPFGLSSTTGSNGHVGSYYFPGDADRGDVARSLFYHDTRWENNGISLVNGIPGSNQMGDLSSLIDWHYLDPPDEFERRRNHTIYSSTYNPSYYSNNRNAFIDNPEFVWSIYGNQQNDSQITISGGTSNGQGATNLNLEFGARILGSPTPSDQSVTINKGGTDGTYFSVASSGAATSSISGKHNAFPNGTTGSSTFQVGLNGSTSIAGLQAGSVTIDNLDITSQGGVGVGANDGDDIINLSFSVLDHAVPSFSPSSQVTSLLHDFGTVAMGTTVADSIDLYNLVDTASFTAGLDFDSFSTAGDTQAFTDDLTPFSNLTAGGVSSFYFGFDTSSIGNYSATYTLSFSDEDLPGATSLPNLSLTLQGTVSSNSLLGDLDLDSDIDGNDIDLLFANLGNSDPLYDVAQNGGAAGQGDVDALIHVVLMTEYGDANLDQAIDFLDLSALAGAYDTVGGGSWSSGDFNGDTNVDFLDLSTISGNYGFDNSSAAAIVPEPSNAVPLLVLAGLLLMSRQQRVLG